MKIIVVATLCCLLSLVSSAQAQAQTEPVPVVESKAFEPTAKVTALLVPQYFHEFTQDGESRMGSDSFYINRARIGLKGEIFPHVGYRVQYAIETGTENLQDALKDTYVESTHIPYHAIRFGQFKTPFGYEQPESESRLLPINRSLVTNSIGLGEDSRDIGIGVWATIPIIPALDAEYAACFVNGQFINTTDDLPRKSFFARAGVITEVMEAKLRVGASGSVGSLLDDMSEIQTDYRRLGGDLTLDHPYLWMAAEYIFDRSDVAGTDMDRSGWYALIGPRYTWQAGVTTLMFRYEIYDPDRDMSDNLRSRLTYGIVHDLYPGVRLMANYEQDASDQPVPDRLIVQTLFSY